jgi:hypothetical protein
MEWKFDEGIVATKSIPHTPLVRRFYYVRYAKGELRRLFNVVMSFGTNQTSEDIVRWVSENNVTPEILDKIPKFVSAFSRVTAIMDFNIKETDQQPKKFEELERDFRFINPENTDENDPISLKYFEKWLPKCSYEKCICTLTNDEESLKRIMEICPEDIPVQNPSGSEQPAPALE